MALSLVLSTMAPRQTKGKAPSKAAPSTPVALDIEEVGDELYEVYNDLLVTKTDLVATAPGAERKRLIGEMGEGLVCFWLALS